jgi:hypothetical protein
VGGEWTASAMGTWAGLTGGGGRGKGGVDKDSGRSDTRTDRKNEETNRGR